MSSNSVFHASELAPPRLSSYTKAPVSASYTATAPSSSTAATRRRSRERSRHLTARACFTTVTGKG